MTRETPVLNPITVPGYIAQGYEEVPSGSEYRTRLTKTNDDNTVNTIEVGSIGAVESDLTVLGDYTVNEAPVSVRRDDVNKRLELIEEDGSVSDMSDHAYRRYIGGTPLLDILRAEVVNATVMPVALGETVAPAETPAGSPQPRRFVFPEVLQAEDPNATIAPAETPADLTQPRAAKQSNGYWKFLLGVALIAACIGSVKWWNNKTAEADRVAYEVAIAVSVLPPGVEQEWMQFVNRRLDDRIRVVEENLLVQKLRTEGSNNYISRNMPYSVDCRALLGSIKVTFGSGDYKTSVEVARLKDNESGSPALPVHPASIAGKQLRQVLCAQVAEYMGRVTNH